MLLWVFLGVLECILLLALQGASFAGGSGAEDCADGDSSGAPPMQAFLADAAQSSGARLWRACGGGHSPVRAGFSGAGVAACGLGVQRLRRQACSRFFAPRWCL